MSRLDYLAKKYLTPDDDKGKKRKRKDKVARASKTQRKGTVLTEDAVLIKDDDGDFGAWGAGGARADDDDVEFGEEAPVTVGSVVEERKRASAGWRRLGGEEATPAPAQGEPSDDEQLVVQPDEDEPAAKATEPAPKLGGLKTADEVRDAHERKMAKEFADMEKSAASGRDAETVYRDASGRRIDINVYRARLQREQEQEAERKRLAAEKEKELNKGLVQEIQKREAEEHEREIAAKSFSMYADDKELNARQKEEEHWEDPAAAFLSKKKEEKKSTTGLKLFHGHFPPNRYNIAPGYRWDGVDRSNGFEVRYLERHHKEEQSKKDEDAYASEEED
ncbi:Pre-mRNA-splicing factor of RES complex-domain-containing protein [Dipodascopsis tothii]|uniref:Pre-mRNA-splicing factor of RES complex-domain-containing protein n=1 Tax=Dipodascopsis tothii TaxID=44089 RepID=UPI0034CF396D